MKNYDQEFEDFIKTKMEINCDQDDTIFDIRKALYFIKSNLDFELTPQRISDFFNISNSHFTKKFKEYTGKNVRDSITMIRIFGSSRVLMKQCCKTSEVPEKVGIQDPIHWRKNFKKIYGITPREYIQQHS